MTRAGQIRHGYVADGSMGPSPGGPADLHSADSERSGEEKERWARKIFNLLASHASDWRRAACAGSCVASNVGPSRTRVAGISALGESVEIFEVEELALPAVDEILIEIATAGIGNWDELVRIGSWQIGGTAPMALGTEAAGTVAAVGSGVAG